jgi:SAM-dependent methyltransferase
MIGCGAEGLRDVSGTIEQNHQHMLHNNPENRPGSIDFILAGATKAATSSLYEYFRRHPEVAVMREDQPHYFSCGIFGGNYTGLEREIAIWTEYQKFIPAARPAIHVGDFDRLTLHGPRAAELVAQANPQAKVLLILRNPIERAHSHYWMDFRECFESRPFLQAVQEDFAKYAAGSQEYCPLIRLGFYSEYVQRFRQKLGPDHVRTWLYDDLCLDPDKVVGEMCDFIGIHHSAAALSDAIRENEASVPKSRLSALLLRARLGPLRKLRNYYLKLPRTFRRYVKRTFLVKKIKATSMPPEARKLLVKIYKDDILSLEKTLGRNLTHWLRDPENPMSLPENIQKAKQAHFFDEATDEEYEIERPRGTGRLYEWSIRHKFDIAGKLLKLPMNRWSLLDICCGSGMAAEFYAMLGMRVTGIDISDKSIARARERARRHGFQAEFISGDAEKLPFADQSFDVVAVHDGLHHLPNPHAAIAEMARVARQSIIVIEPARSWLTGRAVAMGMALDFEDAGNHVYRFREQEICELAGKAGFTRCNYRQYLLYYKHEPFRWARWIENTPLFYIFPLFFRLGSLVAPRLGNKLCVVCERPTFGAKSGLRRM